MDFFKGKFINLAITYVQTDMQAACISISYSETSSSTGLRVFIAINILIPARVFQAILMKHNPRSFYFRDNLLFLHTDRPCTVYGVCTSTSPVFFL